MTRILRVKTRKNRERGFSVLEAMIASLIMIIGIGGLMSLFVVAAMKNAGQGDQATRTTEYAQDKMEQLLALNYNDQTSLVVGATTSSSGGSGLASGGSVITPCSATQSPVANYVDYVVPSNATPVSASPTGALYMRQWMISTDTSLVNGVAKNVKTITVMVTALTTPDLQSLAPCSVLVANKESY